MLDEGIGHSDLLLAVAPIRFITVGGMLAVTVFGNRAATKDIDFLLDPNVEAVQEYRDEVMRVIRDVAIAGNFNEDWMNDDFQIFVGRAKRPALFMQAVPQGVIGYHGRNLLVYAGRLDFALERKLRRISDPTDRARDIDLSDAITLVHWLKGDGGHPLSFEFVRSLDENQIGMPIRREGIDRAAQEYIKVYRTQGIVDFVWDEEESRYKYLDLENNWVFL
jgi:hypothetical protein